MIDYLYRLEARIISRRRSDGGENSAVAAAAYRSGQRLEEGADPKTLRPAFNQDEPSQTHAPTKPHAHDYRRRAGVMGSFIVAPKDAPAWTRDREMLWNAVERAEQRKDSQLAREVIVNLPNLDIFDHLTPANKQKRLIEFYEKMLKSFVNDNFVKHGMVADVAMHAPSEKNDDRHFHAHIMLSTRVIEADGFGKKERVWNSPKHLEQWRESYAASVTNALKQKGIDVKVDHRSYAERGLDITPTKPLGSANNKLERFGIQTRAGNDNRKVQTHNRIEHKYIEKAFEHSPIAPLHEITAVITKSGFADPETVMDHLLEEGKIKRLSSSETGHKCEMYSFTPMIERLNKIKTQSENIHSRKNYALPQDIVDQAIKARGDKKVREALDYVAGREGFKVVETENTGHKTTFISAAADMYKKAGYDVITVARNNQGKEVFKQAGLDKGILTYRDFLRRFGDRYTGAKSQTNKVIIVDEADGLSPLQDQEIFTCARKINAKLIYLGSTRQKKKKLWQSLFSHYKRITEFKRLRDKFFKASKDTQAIRDAFTQAKTLEALKLQRAKYLHVKGSAYEAKRALLEDWFKRMKRKDDKRFILTSRDADAQLFNFEIQKHRLEKKHLKPRTGKMFTLSYKSEIGKTLKRDMSVHWGDMIQFKKTYHDLKIEQGARARVLHHRTDHSLLEMDDGRLMKVDLREANGFDLGYAGRAVSQSGTLEQGYLYHSKANAVDDAPLLYQHSESPVHLYTDKQSAPDLKTLAAQLLGRGHGLYDGFEHDKDILTASDDNMVEDDGHETNGLA